MSDKTEIDLNKLFDMAKKAGVDTSGMGLRKPLGKYKRVLVDVCVLIDRWDKLTGKFVVSPSDAENIIKEMEGDIVSGDELRKENQEIPMNCVGSVWNALILEDPECSPGMVFAIAEDRPVERVGEMILMADSSEQGKDGYAYLKMWD